MKLRTHEIAMLTKFWLKCKFGHSIVKINFFQNSLNHNLVSSNSKLTVLAETASVVTYSEPCQIYKMEIVAEIANSFQWLTIFPKRCVLDVSQSSEYASAKTISGSFSGFAKLHGFVSRVGHVSL